VRIRKRGWIVITAWACTLVCLDSRLLNAQVKISQAGKDHIAIEINGKPFTDFFIGEEYAKPFLAPLRSVDDLIVTRKFPMEQVEGETRDHPHHKGLWIGYGDINKINFWEVEAESKASGDNPKDKGRVQLVKLGELKSGKKSGLFEATFAWLDPHGEPVLEEHRVTTFYADPKMRRFDIDSEFTAKTDAQFADTKEGFFAIRVADSMTGKNGGIITNSEGAHTEKDVWGKPANWADYVGMVQNQKVGILILDNPHNPNHPPRWHARDYGLFAANPFGAKDFDSKATGGYKLANGASARFRYRIIIHPGDTPKKQIASWYSDFAKVGK
jgi:hypothetical protein